MRPGDYYKNRERERHWYIKEKLYYTFEPLKVFGNVIEVAGLAGMVAGVTYTEHDLISIILGSLVALGGKTLKDYEDSSISSSGYIERRVR